MPQSAGPVGANPYADGTAAPTAPSPYAYAGPNGGAPQAGPVPGQQAYGHPAAGPDGYAAAGPAGYPGYGEAALSCRFCGSVPAVEATIRGHQGFLVIMRFLKLQGPFCRSCGIAAHRSMTAKSLWQGWWGIASLLINPATMLLNLPQRAKINKLAPPLPGAPGQPMNPGKPLFQRVAVLGLLVPLLVIGAIVYNVQSDPSFASVGDCVHNKNAIVTGVTDNHPDVVVLSCSDPDADARIVGKVKDSSNGETACRQFSDADGYYTEEQGSDQFTLCLHFLK
ncbi:MULTISPECIES: hypothetical protein [unclassified Kitasatospora]|uniref:LppU/SCO3897 family protein n=1 Tax=unclassified Kitasatospora TaxID=2633591 RepID=UPI00380B5A43